MALLELHREARSGAKTVYHNFLLVYRPRANVIHAFFEGKDDQSFYMNFIQYSVPAGWDVQTHRCGKKDNVYGVYAEFNWARCNRNSILFFVDKDLSDLVGETRPKAENIHVTDLYSIENYLVSADMLKRVGRELLNLELSDSEWLTVLGHFRRCISYFHDKAAGIMAWGVCMMKAGNRPNLNNIATDQIFTFSRKWRLRRRVPLHGGWRVSLQKHLENVTNARAPRPSRSGLCSVLRQFRTMNPKEYIRGKYEISFFRAFIDHLWANLSDIRRSFAKRPKRNVELGRTNMVQILGPRATAPGSLMAFLSHNFNAL